MWCSSMLTLAEHYSDGHKQVSDPFLCGGCGQIFNDAIALRKHLFNQNVSDHNGIQIRCQSPCNLEAKHNF